MIAVDICTGSLGDLGTLIPLLVSLSDIGAVSFSGALFWGGLFNIFSGIQWDLPMPVQPMKSIAAIAIDESLTPSEVACAGICTAGIVFLLGATGLIKVLNRFIAWPVVYGMQIGLGLRMAIKGVDTIKKAPAWWPSDDWDCYALAVVAAVLTMVGLQVQSRCRFPIALLLFFVGIGIAVRVMNQQGKDWSFWFESPVHWAVGDFTWGSLWRGFYKATLSQIPLTTLNSVVSVCKLSEDLFPERPAVSQRSVATSIGVMNLVGCALGGMPMCHGAGGLAGQYRFGARGGASVVFLGMWKLLLAIFFGGLFSTLLAVFPKSILGVLLVFAGLELAIAGRRIQDRDDALVALATAGGCIALRSTLSGCIIGVLITIIQKLLPEHRQDEGLALTSTSPQRCRVTVPAMTI